MVRKTSVAEITVKCRLGVTGRDSFSELLEFVDAVQSTGHTSLVAVFLVMPILFHLDCLYRYS